jgi:hypothetical protein
MKQKPKKEIIDNSSNQKEPEKVLGSDLNKFNRSVLMYLENKKQS